LALLFVSRRVLRPEIEPLDLKKKREVQV
jgi:hypothetical protein